MQPRDAHTQQKVCFPGGKGGPAALQSIEEGARGSVILFFIHCAKCAVNEILLPVSLLALCPKARTAPLSSALTCLRVPTHTAPPIVTLEPREGC